MFDLLVPDPAGVFNCGFGPSLFLSQSLAGRLADATVAHEFQHMINFQVGMGAMGEVWINEGLSHLAEEVVGHASLGLTPGSEVATTDLNADLSTFLKYYSGNFVNLGRYLASPTSAGLLLQVDPVFTAAPQNTLPMRGASWLFTRYLLDRFATPGTEAGLGRRP